MSKRNIGLVVAGVGVVLLFLSVAADVIGLGADSSDGFGTRQIIGTIAGVLVVVVGLVMAYAPWFLRSKEEQHGLRRRPPRRRSKVLRSSPTAGSRSSPKPGIAFVRLESGPFGMEPGGRPATTRSSVTRVMT